MEAANEYPVAEHSSVYVNVDRVGPHLLELVWAEFDNERKGEVAKALRAYHFGQTALFDGEYLPDPEGIADRVTAEFGARFQ